MRSTASSRAGFSSTRRLWTRQRSPASVIGRDSKGFHRLLVTSAYLCESYDTNSSWMIRVVSSGLARCTQIAFWHLSRRSSSM